MIAIAAIIIAPTASLSLYRWVRSRISAECYTTFADKESRSIYWKIKLTCKWANLKDGHIVIYPSSPGNKVRSFRELSPHDGGVSYKTERHKSGWIDLKLLRFVKNRTITIGVGFDYPDIPKFDVDGIFIRSQNKFNPMALDREFIIMEGRFSEKLIILGATFISVFLLLSARLMYIYFKNSP